MNYFINILLKGQTGLVLVLACLLGWNIAQSQPIRFTNYSVENGLQNNIVFASTQDAKGLMWFATSTGIDRFDGNHFVHYALPRRNNTYTAYGQVTQILTDSLQQVWAASQNLLYLYNTGKDRFELPAGIESWLDTGTPGNITSLSLGMGGSQLLLSTSNKFCLYDTKKQSITASGNINQYVRSVYQDKQGMVWVGTSRGVYRFIASGEALHPVQEPVLPVKALAQSNITGISQDELGRYWFITIDRGVAVYNPATGQMQYPNLPKGSAGIYAVKDVYHEKNKTGSYVSLDGAGLAYLNNNLELVRLFQTNEDDPTSLSNNAAYDIYCDRFNRIWITTYGGGINLIVPAVQPFVNYRHEINNNNSLSNNAAKAVVQDAGGNIWFGTRKGLSRLNRSTHSWTHLNEETGPLNFSADNVLALDADSLNGIWVATYGGGLMRVDATSLQIQHFGNDSSQPNSLGTDFVYAVCTDRKGITWAGGIRGPLSYLMPGTQTFVRIKTPVASIGCLIEDSRGNILAGTEKGLYKVQGDSLVPMFPNISTNRVQSVFEYSPGTYWLGTMGGGVQVVNEKKGLVQSFKVKDGLPSDVICEMLKDRNGDVWIGTSMGIAHYQPALRSFTNYTKADGLAGSQVNFGSGYFTRQGEMIFGTTDGFSLFNPQHIKTKGYKPHIVLTALTVNNKQVIAGDADGPLENLQLDEMPKLVLKHFQNSFSIDFVNTSPSISGKHLYSWKLEGFDKEWSQPSTNPTAVYTNLNSGTYNLLIKAFAKGQAEDAEIRRFTIVVNAPWWASIWAYLAYLLLLVAGIYTGYDYARNVVAKKKYAERLRLNTSISHEIRTPLTLIKGPVSALAEASDLSEESRNNMLLARKNIEKLEGIISQFIDYQKTGFDKMQMQVKKGNLVELLDEITASFLPLLKEKNIHFTYSKPSETVEILFDRDKMEKVFNNLISNAVKYTPTNHEIKVAVAYEAKYLVIEVADTGIGIPEEQQQFLFKGYFRADNTINIKETGSGIGLSVAKELIDRHHGKLSYKSEAGKGSVFTVKMPLHNESLEAFLVKTNPAWEGHELPEIGKTDGSRTQNRTILIAEDNDELREYLVRELKAAGFTVLAAADGQQALDLAQKQKPDLLLTDVMMPHMNGFQLCSALKRNISTSHIPVIMLTAIHDEDYLLEGYRSGADDYVKKPFDLAYILTRIDNLLENRLRFRNKIMSVFEQEQALVENNADIKWLKEVTDKIVDQLSDADFSVEKLARMMAMSRPVLFRKFKAITNESPQQYIQQVRLRKAVELLQNPDVSISDVAYACGFSDARYFSTAFKKHFGKSPSEYQKK